jgi:hypothetical protein
MKKILTLLLLGITLFARPLQAREVDGPPRVSTYPNPFQHELVIEIENDGQPVQIKLFNLVGHIQLEQEVENVATLDVSRLPSGTYYLRVAYGNETIVKRIVKY